MNRKDIRDAYDYYTGKVSDIVRQLAYAGIGVIWILKVGTDNGGIAFDAALVQVLHLYVYALAADLLHYVISSASWGIYNKIKEHQKTPADKDFKAPGIINWPSLVFFWGKTALCGFATFKLLLFFSDKI